MFRDQEALVHILGSLDSSFLHSLSLWHQHSQMHFESVGVCGDLWDIGGQRSPASSPPDGFVHSWALASTCVLSLTEGRILVACGYYAHTAYGKFVWGE